MSAETTQLHSAPIERSVLGRLLQDPESASRLLDQLTPDDFHLPEHRAVFEAAAAAHARRDGLDPLALADALRPEVNPEYVVSLPEQASNDDALPAHTKRLHEYTLRRRISSFSREMIGAVREAPAGELDPLLTRLQSGMESLLREGTRDTDAAQSYRDALPEFLRELKARAERGTGITGVPTGFHGFDAMTLGLQRGDMIVLAARPSMGKTSLAMNIAEHAAQQGVATLVFSMEMPRTQLVQRSYASVGRIEAQRLRSGRLSGFEQQQLRRASEILAELPIYVDDTPALTLQELRSRAHRTHRETPVGLIVIDYLQLMKSTSSAGTNRTDQVTELSQGVKQLARELNVPVLLLSQLNRSLESRPDKRPVPSDLRDSGAIEQDADLIVFVYRDEVYYPDTKDRGVAEIIIAKQRNGSLGTVRLGFAGQYVSFDNLPSE